MGRWLQLIQLLAPQIIVAVKPQLAPIASTISSTIQEAEQIKGASGQQKLQHVQNIGTQVAQAVNQIKNKTVIDTSSLNTSIQEAVDTTVAVVNLISKKSTPTESQTSSHS